VQVAGIDFVVQLTGSKWMVTPKARGKTGKKLELNAQVEPGAAVSSDRVSIRITMNGTVHTIEAVAAGNAIRLFMETHREELGKKLAREAALWANSENPEIRADGQALAARLATVQQREQTLSTTYAATQDHAMRHALAVAGVNEIGNSLVAIANEFGIVIEDEAIPRATPFRPYPLNLGRATGAYVDPLSVQSLRPGGPRTQFAPGGTLRFPDKDKYAAGHLVADTFGGPIEPSNLSLISRKTNGKFSSREALVRNALLGTKKIPEPRTVLSYKVSVTLVDNPAGAMESWMQQACAKRFPTARVAGIGEVIMAMLGKDSWNRTTIERHLGWKDIPIAFHDRIMWKAASLYLAKSFTIAIQTYAGRTVPGDSFDNHIDGMKPPEP
jgi:hypothetical protein